MSRFIAVLIVLIGYTDISFAEADVQSDAWKTEPPSTSWRNSARPLGEELFLELPLSKASAAVRGPLSREASLRLNEATLAHYIGNHFRCPPNHHPYLVRALFGHGGTGRFSVYISDGDVIVDHESLGKTSVVNRSALVVCLAGAPKRILSEVGIDE